MINLTTRYLGLDLKNPVIVSSSGLTDSVDKIIKLEKAGAGAVVLKSLFEEQINFEAGRYVENGMYPEAHDYITGYTKTNAVEEYLQLIEGSKKSVAIPVIASINCMSVSEWLSFAKDIQLAGADALEMNMFFVPSEPDKSAGYFEQMYNDLVVKVKEVASIPLSVKLGYYFTNLSGMVSNIYKRGAAGVVLFNRFYEPDIDIDKISLTSSKVFSSPSDIRQSLRWVGLISALVKNIDIAASTGIHNGGAVIKQLLAGATVTEVCSVLYTKGVDHIQLMINELTEWMKQNNFSKIEDFRGRLNYDNISDPSMYERAQFMKYFSGHH